MSLTAAGQTRNIRPKMNATPVNQSLLSELQGHLSADLFASATPVRRAADEVLFVAGEAGNGCYRVEDGLVKVTMMSRAGVARGRLRSECRIRPRCDSPKNWTE